MPSRDEIFDKVRETLVDALGVDDEDVKPTASLTGDLGAESIDFLDIVFRLEKNFSTKIPRDELFPSSFAASDPTLVDNGVVTEKGLAELRARMPHANFDEFAKDPRIEGITDVFTVDTIVNFLDRKLNA